MAWFDVQSVGVHQQSLKLAQITDCHLLVDNETYHGVDSKAYLEQVMIKLSEQPWDCVLVTGDITQDHTSGSYQILADFCQTYLADTTVAWLPGNHDDIDSLNKYFSKAPFTPAKHLDLGHWQVLMLNSKGPTPSGLMSAEHMAEITQLLELMPDDYSVAVFVHHHLLPVNGYIDKHIMTNGEQLLSLLKPFKQVKCISHGHVHQQKHTLISRQHAADIDLWATPSTSMQFAKNSVSASNDDKGPAFRYFQLSDDGRVCSDVIWLNSL